MSVQDFVFVYREILWLSPFLSSHLPLHLYLVSNLATPIFSSLRSLVFFGLLRSLSKRGSRKPPSYRYGCGTKVWRAEVLRLSYLKITKFNGSNTNRQCIRVNCSGLNIYGIRTVTSGLGNVILRLDVEFIYSKDPLDGVFTTGKRSPDTGSSRGRSVPLCIREWINRLCFWTWIMVVTLNQVSCDWRMVRDPTRDPCGTSTWRWPITKVQTFSVGIRKEITCKFDGIIHSFCFLRI